MSLPFYIPPSSMKKTSAEIINEARAAISKEPSARVRSVRTFAAIRPVNTKRPFTPREHQRTLFGQSRKSSRPPSTFSLSYLNNQEDPSTPPSPLIRRLHPLPHPSSLGGSRSNWRTLFENHDLEALEETSYKNQQPRSLSATSECFGHPDYLGYFVNRLRLPAISSNQFRQTLSLDNLPEELETEDEGGHQGRSPHLHREPPPFRKTHSSPVQRTRSIDSELGAVLGGPISPKRRSSTNPLKKQPSAFEDDGGDVVMRQSCDKRSDLLKNKEPLPQTDKSSSSKPVSENGIKGEVSSRLQSKGLTASELKTLTEDVQHSRDVKPSKRKSHDEAKQRNDADIFDKHKVRISSDTMKLFQEKRRSTKIKEFKSSSVEVSENQLNKFRVIKPPKKEPYEENNLELETSKVRNVHAEILKVGTKMVTVFNNVETKEDIEIQPKIKIQEGKKVAVREINPVLLGSSSAVSPNKLLIERGLKGVTGDVFPPKSIAQPTDKVLPVSSKSEEVSMVNSQVKDPSTTQELQGMAFTVQKILATLNKLAESEGNDELVIENVTKLYKALEVEKAIGTNVRNNKVKSQVLKCLYKFVERSNDNLLLKIARIILAFRVRAGNLSGVCKLLFKVSRNDKNDKLFTDDNLLELFLEALGSASPLEDAEACVYGYGALKFLTMNNVLLTRVLGLGALELMVLHMKMINSSRTDGTWIPEQTSHALFQLTGALRNVAGEEDMFSQFVTSGAIRELCRAMELFSSDLDVISNMSRTLSIISTDDECCWTIVDYENSFKVFVRLILKYPGRQDIIVRLGYALGNLMAKSDIARTKFYEEEGAVESLVNVLTIYLEKDAQSVSSSEVLSDIPDSDAGSNGSIEDVIVKMIRIVANMTINPVVGTTLADSSENIFFSNNVPDASQEQQRKKVDKNGSRFVDTLLTILRRKSVTESEELIAAVLSTLNNLSYYPTRNDGAFGERQMEIAQALGTLLCSDNTDCLIEATRVFGNLTRSKHTRDYVLESGGFKKLIEFLDRDDIELLSTTTGILINMMSDWDKRVALKEENGIQRLIKVLQKFGEVDWQLATLICQALWNYCIESTDMNAAFGEQETNTLLGILIDYLDEERLFGIEEGADVSEEIATSEDYQMWDEFAGVATNLMEKIETYLESLEPLEVLPVSHHIYETLTSPFQNPQQISLRHESVP